MKRNILATGLIAAGIGVMVAVVALPASALEIFGSFPEILKEAFASHVGSGCPGGPNCA